MVVARPGITSVADLAGKTVGVDIGRDVYNAVPVRGGGEVAYLTQVFNGMVARLRRSREELADANEALREYYRDSTFVRVLPEPPRMKDIVATNFAALSREANAASCSAWRSSGSTSSATTPSPRCATG